MTIRLDARLAAAALTALSFCSQSGRISSDMSAARNAFSPIVTTSVAFELTLFRLIVSCVFGAIPGPTLSSGSTLPMLNA
jgi:hypothetical protein